MSIGTGNVAFCEYRMVDQDEGFHIDSIQGFIQCLQRKAIRVDEDSTQEFNIGWAHPHTGRTDEGLVVDLSSATVVGLRIDTKTIPAVTLRLKLHEAMKDLQAGDGEKLPAKVRKAAKERIREELLERAPVNTKLYEVIFCHETGRIFFGSHGVAANEHFFRHFFETFERGLVRETLGILNYGDEVRREDLLNSVPVLLAVSDSEVEDGK